MNHNNPFPTLVGDELANHIADYILNYQCDSEEAYQNASLCLLDSIACALLSLQYSSCTKLLGPIVRETITPYGSRVPGTNYVLDPVRAAYNIGLMIRWLDYNDTWLAAEWGHPSDNLGAILAVSDHVNQHPAFPGKHYDCRDIYTAMIKSYEIQGVLALENAFNRVGIDHVILVRVASSAVATALLGGTHKQIVNALSNAWIDGGTLRCYRHAPNTGTRKSWAAGDATARGVQLAYIALQNEMGYPSALTAKQWGFYDVFFGGNRFTLSQPFASYVMEKILFKISYPAEFHAQTAVEAAVQLHPVVTERLQDIDKIIIQTQEPGMRIIDKPGQLNNPADRDHCLQYMVAVALIYGDLKADHYEETTAKDVRIDKLRAKMHVSENTSFTRDYLDPNKRSIANSIQVFFNDSTCTENICIEYPIGHQCRRADAMPLLHDKYQTAICGYFDSRQSELILNLTADAEKLARTPIDKLLGLFATS